MVKKLEEIISQLLNSLGDPASENIHYFPGFPPAIRTKILEAVENEYKKKVRYIHALKSWKEIKDHEGSIKVIEEADNIINNHGVEGFNGLRNDGNEYLLFSNEQFKEHRGDEWRNFTTPLVLNEYNLEVKQREDNEIPDTKKEIEVFKELEDEDRPGEQLDKTASIIVYSLLIIAFLLLVWIGFFLEELGKGWRLVQAIIGSLDIVFGFSVYKYRRKVKKFIISILKKSRKFNAR